MSIHRSVPALLLGLCVIAGPAFAQQPSPLIGEWRGTMRSADNYDLPFDVTFYPNNTFTQTMAVPPSRETGTGSGFMYSRGQYRMVSDHTVEWVVLENKLCAGVDMSLCRPMPANAGPTQFSFRMEGPDKVINTENGIVTYRVR